MLAATPDGSDRTAQLGPAETFGTFSLFGNDGGHAFRAPGGGAIRVPGGGAAAPT